MGGGRCWHSELQGPLSPLTAGEPHEPHGPPLPAEWTLSPTRDTPPPCTGSGTATTETHDAVASEQGHRSQHRAVYTPEPHVLPQQPQGRKETRPEGTEPAPGCPQGAHSWEQTLPRALGVGASEQRSPATPCRGSLQHLDVGGQHTLDTACPGTLPRENTP